LLFNGLHFCHFALRSADRNLLYFNKLQKAKSHRKSFLPFPKLIPEKDRASESLKMATVDENNLRIYLTFVHNMCILYIEIENKNFNPEGDLKHD